MSPILDIQKRIRQIGTVRYGELTTKNGKTYPSTRDTWRVTTSDEMVAAQVADLFGGSPEKWEGHNEAFVVDTDTNRLPVALVPGNAITQFYELWAGGGCKRRCDGEEEILSGGACLCDPENRECNPHTRLSFVLRGIEALGLFRLNTSGYYAAVELAGAVEFVEQRTARGEAPPGWLRIEERRVVRDGKTKVFKVPVLDIQYGIDRMIPAAEPVPALPAPGYTPLPPASSGVSVASGVAAAALPPPATTSARSAAPIGPAPDDIFDQAPLPVDEDSPAPTPPRGAASEPTMAEGSAASPGAGEKPLTAAQAKKLNVLVGTLRDGGKISTQQLYGRLATMRNIPPDVMADVIEGARDEDGDLHWGPLRDSLLRTEASELIDRLEKREEAS